MPGVDQNFLIVDGLTGYEITCSSWSNICIFLKILAVDILESILGIDILRVDVLEVDILGVDILEVDILGVDSLGRTFHKHHTPNFMYFVNRIIAGHMTCSQSHPLIVVTCLHFI